MSTSIAQSSKTRHNGSVDTPSRTRTEPDTNGLSKSSISTSVSMTITPASAVAGSASAGASPYSPFVVHPSDFKTTSDPTVDQSANWQGTPPPLYLPQAATVESSPNGFGAAMTEAVKQSKAPNLIRRLSRGAQHRLRRRPSTQHTNRMRDQSAGPVLMRRRSDSTATSDHGDGVSDFELEPPSEDLTEDNGSSIISMDPNNALGINAAPRKSTGSAFEGGVAPTISPILEQGTWLTKVTKKKRKTLNFRLDTLAAKVCWDASSSTKQFYIDDVREIRVGVESRNSREDIQVPADQEGCWITIVYDVPERSKGRTIKTMHLIAQSEYIVKLWTDALRAVERERIEIMNALSANLEKSERSMQMAWKQATMRKQPDAEQKLEFEDAKWICRKLEINCSPDAVRAHFNEADRNLMGKLDYAQYEIFVNLFKVRKDVQAVYKVIKPAYELELSLESFFKFLRECQGIDVDKDRKHWENKFEYYCKTQTNRNADSQLINISPSMSLQAFQNFLTSSSNSCLGSGNTEGPLDRPLNEYYISSSHNTYLLGRQVAGVSSVEGYIAALVKACRCIEIDCWDGRDGRPIVNHGRTLSTEALFEDCITVINKYAFASSSYPLIISLEVHCNPEQQAIMVEMMTRIFGETMLTLPLVSNNFVLPSPEELRNRILIKVKSTQQLNDGQQLGDALGAARPRSHSSPFVRTSAFDSSAIETSPPVGYDGPESPAPRSSNTWSTPRGSTTSGTGASASSASDSDNGTSLLDSRKKRSKTSNIISALGALGVYTCGIKYTGFNAQEAKSYNHIYSFNENTFMGFFNKEPVETKRQLEQHNFRYLMRVYPAPRRLDSSNFTPLQVWKRGAQMAALNWQTYDISLQLNEAMFAAGTDRTGYVLKPEELRHPKHLPSKDVYSENSKKGVSFVKFSVEIISAQRLPRPRHHNPDLGMNPYIEFEMYSAEEKARGLARGEGGTDASARDGSSGIGSPLRKRTKIAEGNGFDPVFNQPITMTVETKYPSLIFVRWTVWNSPDGRNLSSNSTMLATFTAKLSSLQQGYRHLPLFNAYGERYRDAKLFVKIKKEAPIPLHVDEGAYGSESSANNRSELQRSERSWSRKIFSRTPSERKKSRDHSPYGSFSRTSSIERVN